jgi:hypothetical protein
MRMGNILRAACGCGFQTDALFLGGGMMNFTTYCGAPALCSGCGELHVLNYLDPRPSCPECGRDVSFYNDPQLRSELNAGDSSEPVFSWRLETGTFVLADGLFRCPRCGNFDMRFVRVGYWD